MADTQECQHTEEEPGRHWVEDEWGEEHRIECGCPCDECQEY